MFFILLGRLEITAGGSGTIWQFGVSSDRENGIGGGRRLLAMSENFYEPCEADAL
jgi:hypothetical protein